MPPPNARPQPIRIAPGEGISLEQLSETLALAGYERVERADERGQFAVRGGLVDVFPTTGREPLRIEFWGDEIERISEIDPLRGKVLRKVERVAVYPASHYVATAPTLKKAVDGIRIELKERLAELRDGGKLLEAQRLEQRTMYDLEMLEQMGRCKGIENYSRHLSGRAPGE
jgi:excinuclease ABC subunit B